MPTSITIFNLVVIAAALFSHAVLVTVFMYKEFATKKNLTESEEHLKSLMTKDHHTLEDKIDQIQEDLRETRALLISALRKNDKG